MSRRNTYVHVYLSAQAAMAMITIIHHHKGSYLQFYRKKPAAACLSFERSCQWLACVSTADV